MAYKAKDCDYCGRDMRWNEIGRFWICTFCRNKRYPEERVDKWL